MVHLDLPKVVWQGVIMGHKFRVVLSLPSDALAGTIETSKNTDALGNDSWLPVAKDEMLIAQPYLITELAKALNSATGSK